MISTLKLSAAGWAKSSLVIAICLAGFVFEFLIELPFRIFMLIDALTRKKI